MRRLSLRALTLLFLSSILTPLSAVAATVERTFTFSPDDVSVRIEGSGYAAVTLRGGIAWGRPGAPELPAFGALVDLPEGTRAVGVRATASEFVSVGSGARVRPAQMPAAGNQAARWTDADAALYAEQSWLPSTAAELGASGMMRGRPLAGLRLYPVQTVPATGEIRLATRIELTIELASGPASTTQRRVIPEWEAEFDAGLARALGRHPGSGPGLREAGARLSLAPSALGRGRFEPFAPAALPSVLGSPVKYLIITNEALRPTFETLAQWKTEQGVPAAVRTVEFINANYPYGVDLADRIRRFVRDAYRQWGTVWVLLGGDTPIIPVRQARTTFFGGYYIATDLYYSDLEDTTNAPVDYNWNADGDSLFGEGFIEEGLTGDKVDFFPEVYVGRAPVETVSEAQTWVQKVLNYQKTPPLNFACRSLFFGEVLFPQDWSSGMTIASDGASYTEEAIDRLTGCMASSPSRMYENYTSFPGAAPLTREALLDSMEIGHNFWHHVGHGFRNSMSVGSGVLTNPDIKNLMNGTRAAGLIYSINCTSSAIDFESIGEEFLTAPNGGAVNNVGSTNLDFPATGEMYQNEFYELLFTDGLTRVGQAQALQRVPFVAFANYDNVHRWMQMTLILLGDPELALWSGEPLAPVVTHPASKALGDTTIAVTVTRAGQPLAGAKVCLLKANEEYRVAFTDAGGQVALPFHPQSTGPVTITVTGTNTIPYQATITITGTAAASLVQRTADRSVSDTGGGTNGNGNNSLDAGETVDVALIVRNIGGSSAPSVTGSLKSLDGRASVINGASAYGTIVASGFSVGTPYRIQAASVGLRDGDELRFRLDLTAGGTSWSEELSLTVRAPSLTLLTRTLADNVPGNNNGVLEAGETADVTLTLLNLTEGPARSVTATLVPATANVTVLDGSSTYGAIGALAQRTGDTFRVRNDASATPRFLLTVSDAYGILFTQPIDFAKPPAPSAAVGVGSATAISVSWRFSLAADLAGYNVYRSLAPGGPFTKRNTIPGGAIAYYQDEGLAPLTRYYYYVTAVDSSTNESGATPVISASTNPPRLYGFPIATEGQTPSSPVVGDLDGDADLEVAVGSNVLYAWHATAQGVVDADGTERTSGDFTALGDYYASAPAISDLDNDGQKELIAVTYKPPQMLLVFQGDGSSRPGFPITTNVSQWSWPAVGDIDGDGFKEIVFNSNGVQLFAFRHNGTEVRDGDSNPGTLGVFALLGGAFNFSGPALADLNGDGRLDIVVSCSDGRIYAFKYDGTAIPGFPYGPFGSFTASPAVGDIDNDGLPEIVCVSTSGIVHVVQHNGTNQPGFPYASVPGGGNSRTPSPALIDMEGDGQREILCAGTDGMLRIIRNNGTIFPGWTGVRFTPLVSKATESSPVAADIDGDGQLEILIGAEDAQLYGFRSDGQPFPGFPIRLDGEVRGTPLICDFDQNGNAEILLAGWDKNIYIWTYPGTYAFNDAREWVMFGHDSERTSHVGPLAIVGAEEATAVYTSPVDGGVQLSWRVPADLAGDATWSVFRRAGEATGTAMRLAAVPEGSTPIGGALTPDESGWLVTADRSVTPGERYAYYLQRGAGGSAVVLGPYGVTAPSSAPAQVFLAAAVPNPASGTQTIAFGIPSGLPSGSEVRLSLYDVRGGRVRTLYERPAEAGRYTVTWDGHDESGRAAPAGVYWYRLIAGPRVLDGRLVRLNR
jgi:hypothetical protein